MPGSHYMLGQNQAEQHRVTPTSLASLLICRHQQTISLKLEMFADEEQLYATTTMLPYANLHELDLSGTMLSKEGWSEVLSACSKCNTLKMLSIKGCNLGSFGEWVARHRQGIVCCVRTAACITVHCLWHDTLTMRQPWHLPATRKRLAWQNTSLCLTYTWVCFLFPPRPAILQHRMCRSSWGGPWVLAGCQCWMPLRTNS